MRTKIFTKDKNYTFSDYFEMSHPTREILAAFDYHYAFEEICLPQTDLEIGSLDKLRNTYIKKLPLISLNSEASRREFYLSPFLLELLEYIHAEINVEYPLNAGQHLSGNIDYLIEYTSRMVMIEAKKGDIEKGFNQLAVELIALDKLSDSLSERLYGIITLGDIWRFAQLDRREKLLRKDMNAYVLPADLERIFSAVLGILGAHHAHSVEDNLSDSKV